MPDASLFAGSDLCVVGAVCRDIKTAPLPNGEYLLKDGETSVSGIRETIGGGGANSAGIAANLGAKARFAGVIGKDPLGERLRLALERSGVLCFLHHASGLATGTTVNLVYASGERHFLSCHPNNAALDLEHLDMAALKGARHLFRADVWFSEPMLYGGNERLFRKARRLGLSISLDLNWDPQWNTGSAEEIARRKEAVRRILPLVDLAHGNVRELSVFADTLSLGKALDKLTTWGAKAVVVHKGADGAGYFSRGQMVTAPAVPAKKRLMATGTGDVLSVCMMLLHHQTSISAREKLEFANSIVAQFIEGRRALIPSLD